MFKKRQREGGNSIDCIREGERDCYNKINSYILYKEMQQFKTI